jgi:hypothetical protein
MNSNDKDESYFLHVADDGHTELRFEQEPDHLRWRTHLVKIVEVNGNLVVEEITMPSPHGNGWEHVSGTTWRRTRRAK